MYARNGYRIVYLTARVRLFQGAVPMLLDESGFPRGDIIVTRTDNEQDHPDTFKARVLNEYRAHGWEIAAAYGDSDTDFLAYSSAKSRRKESLHCGDKERQIANMAHGRNAFQNGPNT